MHIMWHYADRRGWNEVSLPKLRNRDCQMQPM